MWEKILKKPITVGTTKVGLKPLPEDDDDECNNKLKAYADKLKSKQMYLKDGYNSKFQSFQNIMKELNTVIFLIQLMVLVI